MDTGHLPTVFHPKTLKEVSAKREPYPKVGYFYWVYKSTHLKGAGYGSIDVSSCVWLEKRG